MLKRNVELTATPQDVPSEAICQRKFKLLVKGVTTALFNGCVATAALGFTLVQEVLQKPAGQYEKTFGVDVRFNTPLDATTNHDVDRVSPE